MQLTTPLEVASRSAAEATRAAITGRRTDVAGLVFGIAIGIALALTLLVLGVLLFDVLRDGVPVLTDRFDLFINSGLRSQAEEAGISQGLRGTFWIGVFTVGIAFPLGIASGIYLEEYAVDSRLTRFININIRNLAGVPSIVYGILGFAIFVKALGGFTGGRSIVAGGITIALLVMPVVIITTAEAVRAVPSGLREAAYAAGATKWEVVRTTVMPYAAPGVLTGTVLALSRALGEAAPLILVGAVTDRLGSDPAILDVTSLQERFTAMPNVITTFAGRPQAGFPEITAAAIVVLLGIVLLFNATAVLLRNHFEKRRG